MASDKSCISLRAMMEVDLLSQHGQVCVFNVFAVILYYKCILCVLLLPYLFWCSSSTAATNRTVAVLDLHSGQYHSSILFNVFIPSIRCHCSWISFLISFFKASYPVMHSQCHFLCFVGVQ